MTRSWHCLLLAIGAAALSAAAWAQQPSTRLAQSLKQPQLRDDEQILPSQIVEPPPLKPKASAGETQPAPRPARPAEPAHSVACSGSFAKDSGHLKLAQLFGPQNMDFTDVEGDEGATLKASVIFPKDPKRRLEVIWDDDTRRAGTRLIVISGQSTWTAPKGLHLGLPIAALEKMNGKPFKVMGFNKDAEAPVSDWNGGSFATGLGDCQVGLRFKADAKASADARAAITADQEFMSNDPALRAVKPTLAEILLAYPQ
jgi:hypothetical protein